MSKISEAKKKQGYEASPDRERCRVCLFLEPSETDNFGFLQKNLRCTLGNFAVKPNALCDSFEWK